MAAKEKKNTARAGALLLAAALVTTVLTSGTLAKYTETVDGTDTARVSLFDFTAEQVEEGTQELTKTGSTIDIFGTSADDTGVFGEDDTNGEKLVAPGMEGYVQFKFTNKSEVAVKVDFDTLDNGCRKIADHLGGTVEAACGEQAFGKFRTGEAKAFAGKGKV